MRLELLAELAQEIGEQRFVRAVRDTIKVSHRRWDCSIARVREMAGLKWTTPISAASEAWTLATQVFIDYARIDAEGAYRLEPKYVRRDGKVFVTQAPEVSSAILRAIQSMGGWGCLSDRSNWSYRYKDFKEIFVEDGPYRDRALAGLEKVG